MLILRSHQGLGTHWFKPGMRLEVAQDTVLVPSGARLNMAERTSITTFAGQPLVFANSTLTLNGDVTLDSSTVHFTVAGALVFNANNARLQLQTAARLSFMDSSRAIFNVSSRIRFSPV